MASRQREWQLRQQALGNCIICGKPRGAHDGYYCPTHRAAARAAHDRSRNRLRISRTAAGLCVTCGKTLDPRSAKYCPSHREKNLARRRTGRPCGRPRKPPSNLG